MYICKSNICMYVICAHVGRSTDLCTQSRMPEKEIGGCHFVSLSLLVL